MTSGEIGNEGQARNTGSSQDAAFSAQGNNWPGVGVRVVPCRPSWTDLRLSAQNCPPGGLQNLLAKPPPSR
jgi:hypothetical protein